MADPPKPSGMSLYADLLAPEKKTASTNVIASAPVRYNMKPAEIAANDGKKKDAPYQIPAYLRPQIQNMKAKAAQPAVVQKPASSLAAANIASSSPARIDPSTAKAPAVSQKSKFEDWVGREDEDVTYQRPNWQSQKRNRNKKRKEPTRIWSWDDVYDPSLPNSYADYKNSDEQLAEIRDWKARLYYHQLKEIDREANLRDKTPERIVKKNPMFAPPPNLNFAPPTFDNNVATRPSSSSSDGGYLPPPSDSDVKHRTSLRPVSFAPSTDNKSVSKATPVSFTRSMDVSAEDATPAASTNNDAIDEAHSQELTNVTPKEAQGIAGAPVTLPPAQAPGTEPTVDADYKASAMAKVAAIKAKLNASIQAAKESRPPAAASGEDVPSSTRLRQNTGMPDAGPGQQSPPAPPPPPPAEPIQNTSTILRAPVRYTQAPQEPLIEHSTSDRDLPPSTSRPGQKNFAERYMQKFGYEKGKGLGAQGEGIVTPIIMKAEKRKKRPDAEGGGWAVPANMGKIVGGKKRKLDGGTEEAEVDMSPVVKIPGMVDGLDVAYEMQEKNLMQRIGDTLSQHHGNIQRIFIWSKAMGGDDSVFVKFNSAVSALGAVNRDGGIVFAGNTSKAVFFDADRFDNSDFA